MMINEKKGALTVTEGLMVVEISAHLCVRKVRRCVGVVLREMRL